MRKDLFFCEAKPISYFSASQNLFLPNGQKGSLRSFLRSRKDAPSERRVFHKSGKAEKGTVQRTSVAKRAKRVSFSLSGKSRKGCHSLVFSKKKRCIFFQRKKNVSKKNEHIFKEVREEWGDYLEPDSWINKEKFDTKDYDSDNLLDCYKKWEKNEISKGFLDAYRIAEKLLKEYKIPFLSEDEINEFMEDANSNKYYYRGLFFSAVINNLFKDKEINLNSDKIKLIGYNNKDKKIVVKGDCGYGIGQWMEDREIVVEGNCGDSIGHGMSGGKIKICGDKFNPKEQISYFAQKGEIYHKDELVWKDGELI